MKPWMTQSTDVYDACLFHYCCCGLRVPCPASIMLLMFWEDDASIWEDDAPILGLVELSLRSKQEWTNRSSDTGVHQRRILPVMI
jgi:hypothetical protein